ncbi:lethal(2) giant larvae protein isoform X1 [Photinus pyralis]|uniref:Lethal giant larvae homologue 2 domain-containing protein n=1 Tax=Photinus pyralis TaxID=7054 RepID=A0A1Y1M6N1_PHOPY|nr:lethal(2) giant larvae protein isoform X1 [Photinus pyralis]
MFKFIRAKGPQATAERQKLQKELFSYRRTLQHGFPNKPTALAWDPSLGLLGIGTASGAIKVFGKPGVEFYGQHQNSIPIRRLVFLPNVGRIISLCDDNSLHLWEVNKSSLVEVKTQSLEGKLKTISAICVESAGRHLLLGTEGGNIYLLDLHTFTMTPDIIYQDIVMQNVPEDYKLNPGAVEAVAEQPDQPNNILIGYNRGLMVLWNRTENLAVKTFVSNQQLESFCWHDDGQSFTSSHNDGSYVSWDLTDDDKPMTEPITTYGPFPCKAIPKIIKCNLKDSPFVAFSGGLPRSSYNDKFTVTAIHNDRHVVFDFTSKVIDFVVAEAKVDDLNESGESLASSDHQRNDGRSEPVALIVLADEELVAIDLLSDDWKMMSLPYLVSLHASAITCSQHVSGVSEELWEQLKDAGKAQTNNLYSNRKWPIEGGDLLCSKGALPRRELLLTGHEDGTVRFWNAGGVCLVPLYKFSTAQLFTGEDIADDAVQSQDDDEEWPPFKKTGVFDPYSDDPRLAIKRVVLCPLSGTLVVAGTAGHLVIAKFDTEVLAGELKVTTMNVVSDRDGFVWKGYDQLTPRSGEIHQPRGFQAVSVLQLHPPAAITCCTLQADWGLIAAGTAHGLALFDYRKQKPVIVKCTLNPNDLTGTGDTPISRRKSFKKSLRESFRRLRKGRSTRRTTSNAPSTSPTSPQATTPPSRTIGSDDSFSPLEAKPVERQIEARPVEDSMGSMVRCLYFARTFIISVQNTTPTLWAGTNNGTVYVFTITIPNAQKRDTDNVACQLGKEIQLKHRAPVIGIAVLDGSSKPLPEPLEVEKGTAPLPDTTQPHRVVIASEEQFKIFTLPSLKPYCKYKLTAHEGARVRRMAFGAFSCYLDANNTKHTEIDLLCLTNLGDCVVLSIPDLKRQLNAAAIRREDINGISSLVFTRDSEALYLHSSSELQRMSLALTYATSARCYLSLPEGARDEGASEIDIEGQIHADQVQDNETAAPLVNGTSESKGSSVADRSEEVRENGEENLHNMTVSSSIGDITIDSVKDHLGSGEELTSRLSNLTVTKSSVTTTSLSNQSGEVTSSSAMTVTTTQENILEGDMTGSAQDIEIKTNSTAQDVNLRAPLALAEGLE